MRLTSTTRFQSARLIVLRWPDHGRAGIVDQDVELTEALDRLRNHGRDGGLIGDVGRDGQALASNPGQPLRGLLHTF